VAEPTGELESLAYQLEELNRVGAALSAERDTGRLLDLILTKAREITDSDAGSIYIVETLRPAPSDEAAPTHPALSTAEAVRQLRFKIAQNDSVALPFREAVLDITQGSIAGYVALTGDTVMLDDAYVLPEAVPYTFNRGFDESAGYRTRSVLAVPMRSPKGNTVGVLQLINAMRGGAAVPYSARQRSLVTSMASQAAVALENSQLWTEIQQLFEGFVRASVVAIEARDPATSGHSFRVANLTVALAEAADRSDEGCFSSVQFSREDMRTIRYASLLHDFGKVGVREEVLVKAKKLYPLQLDLLRERFKLARRSVECQSIRTRLDYVLSHGVEAYREQCVGFEAQLAGELAVLDAHLADVQRANEPSVLPAGSFERLVEIASVTFSDVDGSLRTLLGEDEVKVLSLRKGSLSELERMEIESHVVHTYRFLSQIPWTGEIDRIPAIAVGHHEKLNGSGYPYKLAAAEIPIQTRMMTISDIFDALSASDRPYKKAVPIERALQILEAAVNDGELDRDLFALFVGARVYDRWQVEPYPY
jgi:HD-GYP domain-containing protein (c-di-GMP phosphodiesterase class II)